MLVSMSSCCYELVRRLYREWASKGVDCAFNEGNRVSDPRSKECVVLKKNGWYPVPEAENLAERQRGQVNGAHAEHIRMRVALEW
jgi:hypothetical protein